MTYLKHLFATQKSGFTIFFAMLVASLALAVGIAIYDLTVREIDLSAAASQSQYAIYTADLGVECALYWDNKATPLGGAPSIFATSSASPTFSGSATCNGQNIVANGTPPTPMAPVSGGGWTSWDISQKTASAATTTFTITLLPNQPYCAVVQVGKITTGGVLFTTVTSKGYNNCSAGGPARLERTLQVSY